MRRNLIEEMVLLVSCPTCHNMSGSECFFIPDVDDYFVKIDADGKKFHSRRVEERIPGFKEYTESVLREEMRKSEIL